MKKGELIQLIKEEIAEYEYHKNNYPAADDIFTGISIERLTRVWMYTIGGPIPSPRVMKIDLWKVMRDEGITFDELDDQIPFTKWGLKEDNLNLNIDTHIKEMIISSYELLFEAIDINDYYDFEQIRKNLWMFEDHKKIHHFIILHQSLFAGNNIAEVKFGWKTKDGKRSYDKPPTYDERIFNTHMHILINEILPKLHFDEFHFNANDKLQYRLYRMTLNKILDKSIYTIDDLPKENTLIIKPIEVKNEKK